MVIMLHWMFLTYRRSMSSWRDSCFALFRPQNVKWIAFCNVIFLVMMIKILTFNNDNKYTSQSRTNSTDFHSNNNNQDFAQLEEEDLSKARHVNFWRHLVAGGDWFSLRLPPMLEQNPSLEELFRSGRGLNSDKKTKHCDLCVGGRPKREISWNVFLQMYDRQCTALNVVKKINTSLPTCPCVPKTLVGRQAINISQTFDASRRDKYSVVGPGGYWKPTDCYSRDRVAIIIPFRDRQAHLSILLEYLHPLLQRQQIEYRIFVVEQAKPYVFNKAAIMNTGYLEAKQLFQFDCVVFHDVDMIPEDDRNFYSCINSPRHIAPYVNKWNYTIGYMFLIGGALLLKPDEFERVNGFSNQFYGWGGEDDDMFKRLQWQKTEIYRYPRSVARYTMIQHERDKGNPLNKHAGAALNVPKEHYRKDGINSIKYYLRTIENYALYTWIYVELPEPKKS